MHQILSFLFSFKNNKRCKKWSRACVHAPSDVQFSAIELLLYLMVKLEEALTKAGITLPHVQGRSKGQLLGCDIRLCVR